MINSRLLREFKSNKENGKTVIIKEIKCTPDSCGQEVLSIVTQQISKPFDEVIKGYDIINKTLEVEGHLNLDDNKEYYTNMVGFISDEPPIKAEETITEKQYISNNTYRLEASHFIEVVSTPLQKEIDIEFNQEYKNMPKISITIDKKYEELYRTYSTEFIQNDLKTKYTGVKIIFNHLKTKNSYPEIGITIIGDEKESYFDGIIKEETTAEITLFEGVKSELHIFEMVDMIQNELKNVKVSIEDSSGNKQTFTTDNCGKIYPILKYGTYKVSILDLEYHPEHTIEITENKKVFELDFTGEEENDSG